MKGFKVAAMALLAMQAGWVAPGAAQDGVKIGLVTSLSGPGGYLGQDIRDGFALAVDMGGGKLGGIPVQVVVEDDSAKPGQGKQIVDRLLKNDKVKISRHRVLQRPGATVPTCSMPAHSMSGQCRTVDLCRQGCPQLLVVRQNDPCTKAPASSPISSATTASIVAANYQAGGMRSRLPRFYKGKIAGESFTRLDQTDFAAEFAQIRAAGPEALFQFEPGGLGIAFLRQYQQSGLKDKIPMVVAAPSLDAVALSVVGDAALGVNVTSHWNSDFDNHANKEFMAAWEKAYHRPATYYASQGYDTALAIGAALKGTGGKLDDTAPSPGRC